MGNFRLDGVVQKQRVEHRLSNQPNRALNHGNIVHPVVKNLAYVRMLKYALQSRKDYWISDIISRDCANRDNGCNVPERKTYAA